MRPGPTREEYNGSMRRRAMQPEHMPLMQELPEAHLEEDAERDRRVRLYTRHVEQYGSIGRGFSGFISALHEAQRLIDENVPLPPGAVSDVLRCACGRQREDRPDGLCSGCRHTLMAEQKVHCGFCVRSASSLTAERWQRRDGKPFCRWCQQQEEGTFTGAAGEAATLTVSTETVFAGAADEAATIAELMEAQEEASHSFTEESHADCGQPSAGDCPALCS